MSVAREGACTSLASSPFGCNCSCCYATCSKLGLCTGGAGGSSCGWSTCFDDVFFVEQILVQVASAFCVDLSRIYATGGSNGGMLVHYLAQRLPKVFAGIVPIYGLPLQGMGAVPPALSGTSILQLHDRWDIIIPCKAAFHHKVGFMSRLGVHLGAGLP